MKKTDLIKVIREIVKQELKKELPTALAQVFAQMMGQAQRPAVHSINTVRYIGQNVPNTPVATEMPQEVPEETPDPVDEMVSLKSQLTEMLSGGSVAQTHRSIPQQAPQTKKFTNNPILNEVLNHTRPFSGQERMANRVGGMGAAMSPAVAMAASGYNSPQVATTGVGQMMDSGELGFLNKIPGMPGADTPVVTHIPTGHAQVREGQEGGLAPLEALGEISALDVKNHPALPDSIKGILNRDYRSLVRAMDKKK